MNMIIEDLRIKYEASAQSLRLEVQELKSDLQKTKHELAARSQMPQLSGTDLFEDFSKAARKVMECHQHDEANMPRKSRGGARRVVGTDWRTPARRTRRNLIEGLYAYGSQLCGERV